MKTKRKKQDPLVEYIKANRKGSREAELENHGRPVSHNRIHVDPKATPGDPRWYMVDVKLVRRFEPPVPRSLLRFVPELAGMELMKTGSRLSVQPVEAEDAGSLQP